MYKLYYDTMPGNRVGFDYLSKNVLGYATRLWDTTGSVHIFMSMMGIDYRWTTDLLDPDTVVIMEIDSVPSAAAAEVIEYASKKYARSIVMSTTEPPMPNLYFDRMAKLYPNVLFVANGNHKFVPTEKNIAVFPFFLLRPLSVACQTEVHHIADCGYLTKRKPHVFNHLSRFWAPNKYHMHYTIKQHYAHPSGTSALTSYMPLNYGEDQSEIRQKINRDGFIRMRHHHRIESESEPEIATLYPIEHYINCADPGHAHHFQREKINGDKYFDSHILTHPKKIYTDSYLSLVTEVPTGKIFKSDNTFTEYNYVSEKTVQPILHGHVFLVNANKGFNTVHIKQELGFEIFEELFDYAAIDRTAQMLSSYHIIQQLNQFDPHCIFDNAAVIAEKIHHNRDQLINPNSSLRRSISQAFVNILEKSKGLNR